jgi:hypothetical protein
MRGVAFVVHVEAQLFHDLKLVPHVLLIMNEGMNYFEVARVIDCLEILVFNADPDEKVVIRQVPLRTKF